MAGRKRASDETAPATRASKAAKTDTSTSGKAAKGGKKASKATLATSAFKARALPLHVNITHTPPSIAEDDAVPAPSLDPGLVGSTTLTPTTFSTGAYGWKSSKRLVVELQNSEGTEEKEKVHVMLTINATVIGSKQAKEGEETQAPVDDVVDGEGKEDKEAVEKGTADDKDTADDKAGEEKSAGHHDADA